MAARKIILGKITGESVFDETNFESRCHQFPSLTWAVQFTGFCYAALPESNRTTPTKTFGNADRIKTKVIPFIKRAVRKAERYTYVYTLAEYQHIYFYTILCSLLRERGALLHALDL